MIAIQIFIFFLQFTETQGIIALIYMVNHGIMCVMLAKKEIGSR